jgi:hypothetical protein
MYAGLTAMLGTLHILFLVEIPYTIYLDIWLLVAGFFAPFFFLGGVPEHNEKFESAGYPKVLKYLLLYIVMPLLTVYSVMLCVYFAKILLFRQWPEGMVANLVLWYSMISVAVIFSIYPLRQENRWVGRFIRLMPIAIVLHLAMMFAALWMRINVYGITENRYFCLLAGLWIVGCMVYFIVKKQARMIVLPVSVAIISILAVFGPWNCFAVSALSQNMRFEKILTKYNMIANGRIHYDNRKVSLEDRKEIYHIISYFSTHQSLNKLKYLPEDFKVDQMKEVLGFSDKETRKQYFEYNLKENGGLLDIKKFDYFFQASSNGETNNRNEVRRPIYAAYDDKNQILTITKMEHVIYQADVKVIAKKICNAIKNKKKNTQMLKRSDMTFCDENKNVEVVYVFKKIGGDEQAGTIAVRSVDFLLLIKVK